MQVIQKQFTSILLITLGISAGVAGVFIGATFFPQIRELIVREFVSETGDYRSVAIGIVNYRITLGGNDFKNATVQIRDTNFTVLMEVKGSNSGEYIFDTRGKLSTGDYYGRVELIVYFRDGGFELFRHWDVIRVGQVDSVLTISLPLNGAIWTDEPTIKI